MAKTKLIKQSNESLNKWREKEKKAIELLKVSMDMRLDRSIDLVLFRKPIYDTRPSKIIHNHLHSKNYIQKSITVDLSLQLAKAIEQIKDIAPVKIDLGHLATHWIDEQDNYKDIDEFVRFRLSSYIKVNEKGKGSKDVVLYGFGRIGRIVAREIIYQTGRGEQLRLKAIVIRPKMGDKAKEITKRANLLRADSVHGDFQGSMEILTETDELLLNGNRVKFIFANSPEEIDYTEYGINNALLIDNTGMWRDKKGLSNHLRPGISKVLLSAPGKDIPNIVYGVNHKTVNVDVINVFSAASCTTNAIVPVIKVINDKYGVAKGHIESIHSYTNDQNLLDNFHKKPRRGKGAATNMVLTTTGAASAVAKVIPELEGILTGNAVRVPTPNVSLAILNLTINKATTLNQLNSAMKEASLHGDLVDQIHFSESDEYVSSDAIGMITTSVVDSPSTKVSKDGRSITVYLWYDNEWGYSVQLVKLAKYIAQVQRYVYS